jgi:hypothetical protein
MSYNNDVMKNQACIMKHFATRVSARHTSGASACLVADLWGMRMGALGLDS